MPMIQFKISSCPKYGPYVVLNCIIVTNKVPEDLFVVTFICVAQD